MIYLVLRSRIIGMRQLFTKEEAVYLKQDTCLIERNSVFSLTASPNLHIGNEIRQ